MNVWAEGERVRVRRARARVKGAHSSSQHTCGSCGRCHQKTPVLLVLLVLPWSVSSPLVFGLKTPGQTKMPKVTPGRGAQTGSGWDPGWGFGMGRVVMRTSSPHSKSKKDAASTRWSEDSRGLSCYNDNWWQKKIRVRFADDGFIYVFGVLTQKHFFLSFFFSVSGR
ncbi:hypothetical protein BC939DRAFT_81251 [Gamsiella multidivaricata]|uniref:uncharacterized protein n=1 Tax=Gamsiella multidivaricata TaxID=101098 RepID=UPI00221F7A0E|nr:uncharacterized protein BC939DRAFT_81251 [Gamsiella multidivaricata]KAI7815858.1 hypothetical protein BC939DRAFT_81251 [Gamsiella multidivaricata]